MGKPEDINSYVETCREVFWQNIFQFETRDLISRLKDCRDVLSVGCGPAIIESCMKEFYAIQTEYILGIKGESIFKSTKPSEAALYVIQGKRRQDIRQGGRNAPQL